LEIRLICDNLWQKNIQFPTQHPFRLYDLFFNRKERKVLRKERKEKSLIVFRQPFFVFR